LNFRFGMAVDLDKIFFPGWVDDRLTFAYEIMHPRDYSERAQFGLEFSYKKFLALRSGYKINFDEQGLTGGFGIMINYFKIGVNVDYAIADFGAFGFMHRFGIGLSY
jgi:hypothetical protein